MRVLITGANGSIGRRLVPYLAPHHDLVFGDLRPPAHPAATGEGGSDVAGGGGTSLARARLLDVTRLDEVQAACDGVDAIVHLAIASGREGDYEDDLFNDLRFDVNVKGTRNVFEAAARCGVRRVVYTSSLTVVWGYGPHDPVGADAEARPVGTYALTKHLGEIIARYYHQAHDISTICLRIAKPVDLDDRSARDAPIRPQWIAFPDLCRAYRLALECPDPGFEIIHLVGESSARRWDLSAAERVLGYRPEYRLEELGYSWEGEH